MLLTAVTPDAVVQVEEGFFLPAHLQRTGRAHFGTAAAADAELLSDHGPRPHQIAQIRLAEGGQDHPPGVEHAGGIRELEGQDLRDGAGVFEREIQSPFGRLLQKQELFGRNAQLFRYRGVQDQSVIRGGKKVPFRRRAAAGAVALHADDPVDDADPGVDRQIEVQQQIGEAFEIAAHGQMPADAAGGIHQTEEILDREGQGHHGVGFGFGQIHHQIETPEFPGDFEASEDANVGQSPFPVVGKIVEEHPLRRKRSGDAHAVDDRPDRLGDYKQDCK